MEGKEVYKELILQVHDLHSSERRARLTRYRMLNLRREWITHQHMADILLDASKKVEQAMALITEAKNAIDNYAHEDAPDNDELEEWEYEDIYEGHDRG